MPTTPAEAQGWADVINGISVAAMAIFGAAVLAWAFMTEKVVPGSTHRRLMDEAAERDRMLRSERDDWKNQALRSVGLGASALDVARLRSGGEVDGRT